MYMKLNTEYLYVHVIVSVHVLLLYVFTCVES